MDGHGGIFIVEFNSRLHSIRWAGGSVWWLASSTYGIDCCLAILGRRFAAALLPRLFGKNPRSHHKGATGRVRIIVFICRERVWKRHPMLLGLEGPSREPDQLRCEKFEANKCTQRIRNKMEYAVLGVFNILQCKAIFMSSTTSQQQVSKSHGRGFK